MAERRAQCEVNTKVITDLESTVFGNGKLGIKDRVMKLEVLMWIVIVLLVGNGSLLGWTIKTLSVLSKVK